ncbi:hypothetical protein [uncultured Roseobacter sp.]|uniref:hypothetical protein n=1 Tax=uncultured Roseobacter sp. TaxID=114847 RepID=UPI00263652DF|nr:hypothetical protein [uncultured Roseobacter sp.]
MRFITLTPSCIAFAAAHTARRAATKPVAEIVTFRLLDGADPAAVRAAAEQMTPFLSGTGTMLTRTLSCDDTGLWTDHIIWTSMKAALAAADQIMSQPSARPFMAMIDPETVVMRHAPVHLTTTAGDDAPH